MDKEIIKLQNTKAAIKQALIDKGCNPTDEFASYADNIKDIETGGEKFVCPAVINFSGSNNTTNINAKMLDVSNVVSMTNMFGSCTSLISLDVSNWNTSNVVLMKNMFKNCSKIKELDLTSFDTSKVTDMSYMFESDSKLEYLNLGNWNTQSIKSASTFGSLLYNCSGLIELHWRNFCNGVNATAIMLNHCTQLGINTDNYPNARQSLIDMLITYSFDRANAGYAACTLNLSTNTKALLTEDEIAQITAKGFTIA